tara:strand:- start:15922 stop:17661 length:1740 start_codon:yes stop_codon:yes gene_type:complete
MIILGINAFHPDSSACIVKDGKILAAIEEERIVRLKHWAGFPKESIKTCLNIAGITINEVDKIAINRDQKAHQYEKILFTLKNRPSLSNIYNRIQNRKDVGSVDKLIANLFDVDVDLISNKIVPVEHHFAHLTSTFFTSPFEESVILSIDGFGDFLSTMWGFGKGNNVEVDDYVTFPHSLGMLYQAITQYLGFANYGDEYKVMGMAAYGEPKFIDEIKQLIKPVENGKFELNIDYFNHPIEGVSMEFDGGYPTIGNVFSKKMINLLGDQRSKEDPVEQKHKDIACSLQKVYEETLIHILKHLNKKYPHTKKLCLAGGCAQNSLANGKITSLTDFDSVWIQPAAGDAGGALGAALAVSNQELNEKRHIMHSPSLGQSFSNNEIQKVLNNYNLEEFNYIFIEENEQLVDKISELLIDGNVIGFFHGAYEWGPRALGNRSIIVDPRIADMKGLLNEKIKKRESFRPFAPSVLREHVSEWFEKDEDVPFMTHVFNIKNDKKSIIPAVTHEDGTGRLQSVTKDFNLRYYEIINDFFLKTGVPMILNTSFNENEPIVSTPKEALECFLRTNMDVIVLENHIILRK